jgi:hypothetical protein
MLNKIETLSEDDINSAISNILAGMGHTERDFQLASHTYNSVFFKDLPENYVRRACAALRDHFVNNTNNFWNKKAANEFV